MYYGSWTYVPVAERRAAARKEVSKREKAGHKTAPVVIAGRTIASTFWGKAWCTNLERYSDYANRLPRGRTYVRNGSVVDLQIAPGQVTALVSGSRLYHVTVTVAPVAEATWSAIRTDCAGGIDSLVELLQGRLSKGVMERICRPRTGLFPASAEIKLHCSCPDGAVMCKHVAAVLYGVGARLDERPELLFLLRGKDATELVAQAAQGVPLVAPTPQAGAVLASDDLAGLFGLDLLDEPAPPPPPRPPVAPAAAVAQLAAVPQTPLPRQKPAALRQKPAAPRQKPAAPQRAQEQRALREALANVEARLAALRAEPPSAETKRTIATLQGWIEKTRAKLA